VLEQLGVMADAIGAHVLVDEVYAEAQHDERPAPMPAATLGSAFISTNSLTKAYGLSGLRCGWIVASPALSRRIREARDVIDGSGPFVAERLSLTAFENIDRLRTRARNILAANLDVLRSMAQAHPRLEWIEPAAGTTAFPRVLGVADTSALVERLICDYDTIVVPGHFFQAPEHIRVAFGGEAEMVREAVGRLDEALRDQEK
jgi:aspartate/methionine/tyrosine aminotransferase